MQMISSPTNAGGRRDPPDNQRPSAIRAQVSARALAVLTDLFDSSTIETASELLQNARRAGATEATVSLTEQSTPASERPLTKVCFADNGCGIANPGIILAFGESNWESEAAKAERPAGMGFFAAAHHGQDTMIESRPADPSTGLATSGWSATLTDDHFRGDADAQLQWTEFERPTKTGTTVSLVLRGRLTTCRTEIETAAEYCGMTVFIGGKTVDGTKDFLLNPQHFNKLVGIVEGPDVRISVRRTELSKDRHSLQERNGGNVNFHGRQTREPEMPTVRTRPGGGDGKYGAHYSANVDIIQPGDLRLTLPTRLNIIRDAARERLMDRIQRAIYSEIARAGTPVILSLHDIQASRGAGTEIPLAAPALLLWSPTPADERAEDEINLLGSPARIQTGLIVMPAELAAVHQTSLADGLKRAAEPPWLAREDPGLRGLPWYDGLPRVTRVTAIARKNGDKFSTRRTLGVETAIARYELVAPHRVSEPLDTLPEHPVSLDIELEMTTDTESVSTHRIPVRFIADETLAWNPCEINVVGPDSPKESIPELAKLLRIGLCSPPDDEDYDLDALRWEEDLEHMLLDALNAKDDKDRLSAVFIDLQQKLQDTIDREGTYTIRMTRTANEIVMETLESPPAD